MIWLILQKGLIRSDQKGKERLGKETSLCEVRESGEGEERGGEMVT